MKDDDETLPKRKPREPVSQPSIHFPRQNGGQWVVARIPDCLENAGNGAAARCDPVRTHTRLYLPYVSIGTK